VFGQTSSASGGVHGKNTASGPDVIGEGGAFGVHGISGSGSGVNGTSADGFGVAGTTNTSHGLDGLTFGSGASGVSGRNFAQDSAGKNGVTGLSVEGTGVAAQTANIEAIVVGRNFRGGYAGAFDSDIFADGTVFADAVGTWTSVATNTLVGQACGGPSGYQRPRCTTSSNGRLSGRRTGASGRSAG
jgi:hypothetical protein